MHKVHELEDRWFNYKVKKLISPVMRFSALSLVFAGSYYTYSNQNDILSLLAPSHTMTNVLGVSIDVNNTIVEKSEVIKKEEVVIVKTEEIIEKKEILEIPKVLEKIVLVPIIPVIDMDKEERISHVKRVKSVKRVKATTKMVKAKKNAYLTTKELSVITKSQRKSKKMNFTSTSSNYLETMKHKFAKSNSPRDALLLAKTYYKNLDYVASEKWALSANKLDNSLEDSWLLFAKSKAKLGKKKEALKVLVSYYKKSKSLKAKRLIGQIQTGRI
jgi:hypothetical protein